MIPSTFAAASDTAWAIITGLVVILVSAAIVAVVMQPMRLAAIPAYLIVGAVVGPRALGLVPSPEGLVGTEEDPPGAEPESNLHTVSESCDEDQ
jgi:hypothetical protein